MRRTIINSIALLMECEILNCVRHLRIEVRNYYKCQSKVVPKTKIHTHKLSLIRILAIVEEAINADNIKAKAQKYMVSPAYIRKLILMIAEIRAVAQITSYKLTFNEHGKSENSGLELQVFDLVMNQR